MTLSILLWAARRTGLLTDPPKAQESAHSAWHAKDAERRAQEEARYRLSALGIPPR